MKKMYVICFLGSFSIVFNICAMNMIEKKETADFKELKLLAEKNEYLKNVEFPVITHRYTKMPLDELDPEIIIQTDECKKLLNKSQETKNQALQDAFNFGRGDRDYSQRRFLFACALVAGADPNKGEYDNLVLLKAALHTDYWLARLALLCGADPNKGWRDFTPLENAETVEMAKLLIYCGADIKKTDDVLYKAVSPVWECHWQLLEFYLTQKIKWKDKHSPFWRLLNDVVSCLEDTDQDFAENHLRKMKLLFNAGYQVEDEFLKELRETIKRPHLLQALILSALKTSKFDLHQFLYRLHNDDGYKEKNSMYLFAKNHNKTDVMITYL